ncbi:MAG TPA: BrnA antitoxin family protein [Pseudolabrys sp.]|nr:BrnA antitoxin family protein [Pseudolabrys sp.]
MRKRADAENPEWTKAMMRRAKPASKVFPNLQLPKPRGRGPQREPVKVQTTIRLDRDVIEYFRRRGRGWQTRLNSALRDVISRKRKARG